MFGIDQWHFKCYTCVLGKGVESFVEVGQLFLSSTLPSQKNAKDPPSRVRGWGRWGSVLQKEH